MVAPSGSTKLHMFFGKLRLSSQHSILIGSVAPEEVVETFELCHGAAGARGTSALVSIVDVDADPAGPCPAGGKEVVLALDLNGNDIIDEDSAEIQSAEVICNGISGSNAIAVASDINPGGAARRGRGRRSQPADP